MTFDEEKSKHGCLAEQNGFDPAFLHPLLRLVKEQQSITTTREECNNYVLTRLPVSHWPIIIIFGPGALLLVVSHLFAVLVLVFWVGMETSK